MAIQEVITELKQPTQQVSKPKPKMKIVEKKKLSNNTVLNDVLNETAKSEEWKTMGGETYDSGKMGEVLENSYGDMMNGNSEQISVGGQTPDFLKKDYRAVMKAIDKKQGK